MRWCNGSTAIVWPRRSAAEMARRPRGTAGCTRRVCLAIDGGVTRAPRRPVQFREGALCREHAGLHAGGLRALGVPLLHSAAVAQHAAFTAATSRGRSCTAQEPPPPPPPPPTRVQ
jgi:hypothetical protein